MPISTTKPITKGLVTAMATLLTTTAISSAQPEEIVLHGQIRDFQSSHPDFGLASGTGGAVTGLAQYYSFANRPVYMGSQLHAVNGLELTQNALDAGSHAIAPHMFADSPENTGVLVLKSAIDASGNSTTDHYDPLVGYDEDTARDLPPIDSVAAIPSVEAPVFDPAPAKTVEMQYKKTGGYTSATLMAGNYHTDDFIMSNGFELVIVGDVNIRVDTAFSVTQSSVLTVTDGSTLTFWIGGSFIFRNSSQGNTDNWDHARLTFMNFGNQDMQFDNYSDMVATIVAPDSDVIMSNNTDFFGAMTANSVTQDNTSGVHIAGEFAWLSECFGAGDTQQAAGTASDGQITSSLSFATWFGNAPGLNLTDTYQLVMTENAGSYEFSVSDWDPIGDELYGNEGATSNRNFTLSIGSLFFNDNCNSMFFEVQTEMDFWVFIDDVMVIDLGGPTSAAYQRIDLDRLGLGSDTWHTIRVFIAARVDGPQELRMRTSIPLTPARDIVYQTETFHD